MNSINFLKKSVKMCIFQNIMQYFQVHRWYKGRTNKKLELHWHPKLDWGFF